MTKEWITKVELKDWLGGCKCCGVSLYDVPDEVHEGTRAAGNSLSNLFGRKVSCPVQRCDSCIIAEFPGAKLDIAKSHGKNNLGRLETVLAEDTGYTTVRVWCEACGDHIGERRVRFMYTDNTVWHCFRCKMAMREKAHASQG